VSRKRGGSERGLGLGLYISREIVRAHGGEITVTSSVGAGTAFTIRLPLGGHRGA
jgi:two-component system CheB/CheR fusion protein